MLKPTNELLHSMAMRYDHSFGLLEKDDPKRKMILTTMLQLWEEVAGEGFYQGQGTLKQYEELALMCRSLEIAVIDPILQDADEAMKDFGTLGVDVMKRWTLELSKCYEI